MERLKPILWIMLGISIWGVVHAYGAYLLNHNPLRGLVVGAFTGGFLAFWGLMIYWKWDHLTQAGREEARQAKNSVEPPKSKATP